MNLAGSFVSQSYLFYPVYEVLLIFGLSVNARVDSQTPAASHTLTSAPVTPVYTAHVSTAWTGLTVSAAPVTQVSVCISLILPGHHSVSGLSTICLKNIKVSNL